MESKMQSGIRMAMQLPVEDLTDFYLPYSGLFSWGANFYYFHA